MAACLGLFGLAVTAMAFGAATRPEDPSLEVQPQPQPQPAVITASARFFSDDLLIPPAQRPRVPIEVLLLQIESHVRLEQAAAESFLAVPTAALLHGRTTSPLVH
jgi:hypothetical protein